MHRAAVEDLVGVLRPAVQVSDGTVVLTQKDPQRLAEAQPGVCERGRRRRLAHHAPQPPRVVILQHGADVPLALRMDEAACLKARQHVLGCKLRTARLHLPLRGHPRRRVRPCRCQLGKRPIRSAASFDQHQLVAVVPRGDFLKVGAAADLGVV